MPSKSRTCPCVGLCKDVLSVLNNKLVVFPTTPLLFRPPSSAILNNWCARYIGLCKCLGNEVGVDKLAGLAGKFAYARLLLGHILKCLSYLPAHEAKACHHAERSKELPAVIPPPPLRGTSPVGRGGGNDSLCNAIRRRPFLKDDENNHTHDPRAESAPWAASPSPSPAAPDGQR